MVKTVRGRGGRVSTRKGLNHDCPISSTKTNEHTCLIKLQVYSLNVLAVVCSTLSVNLSTKITSLSFLSSSFVETCIST